MITEIFKPIKGYEGLYEISNFGRVKSLPKRRNNGQGSWTSKEKILKNCKDGRGYPLTHLYKKKTCRRTVKVHRLVAIAFIPNPKKLPQVNHKDGVKTNNFWKNLEWCTNLENIRHAFRNGIRNTNHLKKRVAQIKDGKTVKIWESQVEVGKHLNIDRSNISGCCRGKYGYKTAGGFQWKFI